jgi:hypothetical protein
VNPAALTHKATNKAGNTDYWYSIHNPKEIKNCKQITNLPLGADNAWKETQYLGMTLYGIYNQKSQCSTTLKEKNSKDSRRMRVQKMIYL